MLDSKQKELSEIIYNGREDRRIEYKESMQWKNDNNTKMKVLRAAMSFANIEDGGFLVFGVKEDKQDKYKTIGMDDDSYNSFNQDDVQSYVNEYADPYVNLKVEHIEVELKKYIVIIVSQFDLLPVVCKKNGIDVKQGQIFTRPHNKNSSVPVSSQSEMREIIELAVDLGVQELYKRLGRIGMTKNIGVKLMAEYFDKQLNGL